MIPISFRLLDSKDRENYRQKRLECLTNYPEFFGDTYEEEISGAPLKFDKALRPGNDNSFLIGAFSDDSLVGISGFIQDGRIKTNHRGDLVQVYVDPSFSGQGIGSKLVELTISRAFENSLIDQILLGVVHTNEKAIRLYKKHGFVEYGMLENYFKRDENSWTQLFMALTREKLVHR